ncbi:MAG: hypothetical protein QHH07_01030 [Sedimentisphaerales bacterium]|nr:hypothetical protein [Sedimentisphaerales bacterium]
MASLHVPVLEAARLQLGNRVEFEMLEGQAEHSFLVSHVDYIDP